MHCLPQSPQPSLIEERSSTLGILALMASYRQIPEGWPDLSQVPTVTLEEQRCDWGLTFSTFKLDRLLLAY